MGKRKAVHSKRVQKNKKARKVLTEGLRRSQQEQALKNLKESTGVDVDAIVRRNKEIQMQKEMKEKEEKEKKEKIESSTMIEEK